MRRVRSQFQRPVFRLPVVSVPARAVALVVAAFVVLPASQAVGAVTVSIGGPGTGTVTSVPAGVNCGNTPGNPQSACVFDFAAFTSPSFTATPDAPNIFYGWSGTNGGTCVSGAANPCSFQWNFGGTFTLMASFGPVPDPPVATTSPVTDLSYYGATLEGQVNPSDFAVGDCHFEYGQTSDYGNSVDCAPANIPAGSTDVAVSADIGYLQPDTTYHYRLVADNPGGADQGADQTFTTATAPADNCDNADIRAQQGTGVHFLPDCMAYEIVSNGDTGGTGIVDNVGALLGSGDRAQFFAQVVDQPASVPGWINIYTALRDESGWSVNNSMTPSPAVASGTNLQQSLGAFRPSSDLGRTLMAEASVSQRQLGQVSWEIYDLDGTRTNAYPLITPLDRVGSANTSDFDYELEGTSNDLSRFFFRYNKRNPGSGVGLMVGEPTMTGNIGLSNIYAITGAGGANPKLDVLNRATDPAPGVPGTIIGGACGAGLGGRLGNSDNTAPRTERAVSEDGAVAYFSVIGNAPPASAGLCGSALLANNRRIYKREGSTTVAVSESQCARVSPVCAGSGNDRYMGASADGSVVVFTSPRQLTDSDLDTTSDVYVYDSDPPAGRPNLIQASAGEAVPGHTVGAGAVVDEAVDVSADGSRFYFAASGVLTDANSRGESPVAGQRNLYVFERDDANPDGRIELVATVSAGDAATDSNGRGIQAWALPVDGSGDGHFLLFNASPQLVADDADSARDIYRYDDTSGEIVCASCDGDANTEAFMVGRKDDQDLGAASSDVSKVVFETAERVLDSDRNDTSDVYVWDDGAVSLITGGTGTAGVSDFRMSSDGDSVFFTTRASVLASDVNRQRDLYVARVGGGFPEPPAPPAGCEALADACQGGGAGSVGSDSKTAAGGAGNADPGVRGNLALGRLGVQARKRAARTGVLAVTVRSGKAGVVRLLAKARIGKQTRQVGKASKALAQPGSAKLALRLNRAARKRLASGAGLSVRIELHATDARSRSMTVRLPGASS
jgi:hypothetical protein